MKLNSKQKFRKEQIEKALSGLYTNRQLAFELNLSLGRSKAVKRNYKKYGEKSLIHGNTGKKPVHTITEKEINRILEIKESTNNNKEKIFEKANFSHFTDILNEMYGIKRCRNTISKILKNAGYKSPKKRRANKKEKVHERRPPKERIGELVQGDATPFDWLDDGHVYALHAFIDDATKEPLGMYMTKNECSFGYYECMRQMLLNHGKPEALYVDKLSVFSNNIQKLSIEEQLQGKQKNETQFSETCKKLGIELILAQSPQAKGRVERFWSTVQSRLPVELKIRNISTIEEVNKFLPIFMQMMKKRFGIKPKDDTPAFQPLSNNEKLELAKILAVKIVRKTDWGCILSLKNYLFKVPYTPHQKITIYLSVQDGIYGITQSGKKVELELFDENSSDNLMPQVWKDLIEEYFFKDAKAKYRFAYKKSG